LLEDLTNKGKYIIYHFFNQLDKYKKINFINLSTHEILYQKLIDKLTDKIFFENVHYTLCCSHPRICNRSGNQNASNNESGLHDVCMGINDDLFCSKHYKKNKKQKNHEKILNILKPKIIFEIKKIFKYIINRKNTFLLYQYLFTGDSTIPDWFDREIWDTTPLRCEKIQKSTSDDVLLLKWPYTIENSKKNITNKTLKRDYKIIKKIKVLYNELFNKVNDKYIEYTKLQLSKDFNIKEREYIEKIRKYHEKQTDIMEDEKIINEDQKMEENSDYVNYVKCMNITKENFKPIETEFLEPKIFSLPITHDPKKVKEILIKLITTNKLQLKTIFNKRIKHVLKDIIINTITEEMNIVGKFIIVTTKKKSKKKNKSKIKGKQNNVYYRVFRLCENCGMLGLYNNQIRDYYNYKCFNCVKQEPKKRYQKKLIIHLSSWIPIKIL
jgi:hypothetical protein